MFTSIQAATDKPALADSSVLTAMQIAKHNDAGLYIIHVLEPLQTDGEPLVRHFQTGQPVEVDVAYKAAVREEIIKYYPGLLADISGFHLWDPIPRIKRGSGMPAVWLKAFCIAQNTRLSS